MSPPDAWFRCDSCGAVHPLDELYRCPACGGELLIGYDYGGIRRAGSFDASWRRPGDMWARFAPLLPQRRPDLVVSLGEGSTPLIRASRSAEAIGVAELYFKLESCNPTGSFKDRQVSLAMSKAAEWGRRRFGTASSGNVGVALSAYAARAGMEAFVWVSASTAAAKRQQIQIYGAQLFLTPPATPENNAKNHAFFTGMRAFCLRHGMVPMISARPVNPLMVEGCKTIAFEVVADLGRVPDKLFGPVGGGGLIGGTWKGFRELLEVGLAGRLPELHGAQMVKGHIPIDRLDDPAFDPETSFRPLDGAWAWQSIGESGGALYAIDAAATRAAQAALARTEGIFAEPQGISAFAGLLQAAGAGRLSSRDTIVCVITGIGLKDMQAAGEILAETPGYPPLREVSSLEESF